jgi:hypothetical protein
MKTRAYTLLPIEDIAICDSKDNRLEMLKQADSKKTICEPTIYAVLTGAYYNEVACSCY